MKPFQNRVQIVAQITRDHIHVTNAEDARWLCEKGLAVQLAGAFTAFVGRIELTVSVAVLREIRDHQKRNRKGAPKRPLKAPQSSTGDAGRGCTWHPTYRTIHLRPTA